jgi:hypothetical protein
MAVATQVKFVDTVSNKLEYKEGGTDRVETKKVFSFSRKSKFLRNFVLRKFLFSPKFSHLF